MTVTTFDAVAEKIDATFADTAKLPLSGPDNHQSPHYGIARTDLTGPEAWFPVTVKKGYVAHTTDDVKTLCLAAADGFQVDPNDITVEACWAKNGHRVCIQPTKDYRRRIVGRGDDADTVWPRFIVRANYGGKFTASAGMYRDACSNMQMMRKVQDTTLSLRHTASFRDHFDETVKEFKYLATKYENVVEASRHLASRRASVADFVSQLLPPPEANVSHPAKLTRYSERVAKMIDRLTREQVKTGQDHNTKEATLWSLANMVTGYVQHEKHRVGEPSDVVRAFMAADDKLCDDAWSLAFSMAS